MRARDRREHIAELAQRGGHVTVEELSAQFDVSASTIRRDLQRLAADGQLARTYGGLMSASASGESTLPQRHQDAAAQKWAIGAAAAATVRDGETLYLDGGSTVDALAAQLDAHGLVVVTPSVTLIHRLAERDDVELICTGGRYRSRSQSFVGPLAEGALDRLTFDRAFLSADAVHAEFGLCEVDPDQSRLKDDVVRRSREVYVLAHAAKLQRTPYNNWTPLPTSWTLVTDREAATEDVDRFTSICDVVLT